MKIKFTDKVIKDFKATGQPYSYGDTDHKGLLVRVSARGIKTFALAYYSKRDQKPRTLTFGRYGDVTLADAFDWHAETRAAIANGDDPNANRGAVPSRDIVGLHALHALNGLRDITGECNRVGIYFLCLDNRIIYVGQSVRVNSRLRDHARQGVVWDTTLFLPCAVGDLNAIEAAFIRAFRPAMNGVIANGDMRTSFSADHRNNIATLHSIAPALASLAARASEGA